MFILKEYRIYSTVSRPWF